ncbi:phage head-tail connector protein [Halalkalibacter okhensis]|uniref:DNA-packaging protein n=1 Tax=Halalkalibacter okhensis TaxID=333138 RepID=A0A0B0IIJ5_9BACI|nr:phage head-tail connector protein [Halalkalibacter okhensis]KHF40707.1 hypothetical protein LQ50_07900 [Halalkalibacter okhensis]
MAKLDHVKTLLEKDILDTTEDVLLNLYIQRATDFVTDYCNLIEIPISLNSVIEEMAVFSYLSKGVENITSEGKGSLNESYITEYPSNIMNRLDRHRRIRVV